MNELQTALSYPGMSLELFHWYGAPPVAELQQFLNGVQPNDAEVQQMADALGRIRASGKKEF